MTDLYIPTFGLIPNSSYVPAKFRNANGFVTVDEYLKVKGAENVWAIGDVSDLEPLQFMVANNQSAHLAKNIILILSKKMPLPYKLSMRGMIAFLPSELEFWLILCRYGRLGRQKGRNWVPRKRKTSRVLSEHA